MYAAIEHHKPQQVIHLGDMISDAEEVAKHYPKLPFCMVPGKSGYDQAIADARAVGVDILLFGHTHIPLCQQLKDGLWMMNPGPARSSYGMIKLGDGPIACTLHKV